MVRLPWRVIAWHFLIALFGVLAFSFVARLFVEASPAMDREQDRSARPAFEYAFADDGILHESSSRTESSSPYWWVDSGAKLIVEDGVGKTLSGELDPKDAWRSRYERSSSRDTNEGAYPQNIFRLLTVADWENVAIESSFRIIEYNRTDSPNRNESNGLLLIARYRDGNNLYYAGLRVDGHAVIKKKYNGTYHTMIETPIIEGNGEELLTIGEWITLGMETRNEGDDVRITLSQKNGDGSWKVLASAIDTGQWGDTEPILGSYPVGIRTDFMDVEFDDFRARSI